ncbi:alpha/beta fold hydrolase [Pseudoroseicyclus aestuarii]|uniref:Pimeloyl-ACP methyl ester carboxylesterase n=1 Tax=Pseudoroseicyclus aestuarii TaxID=1795041 RepID=A0A318T0I0_9RHOB|nr:alpha/beta hydrolase [Pseudoroseicyclus aestuarii]PYE85557.1 pimeloyl-ACP methyl ester carboxylesterase [Pseudoroseicyclus aestuarii]
MLPLVLLPGMMCDARLFVPQIAALSGVRAVQVAPLGGQETTAALAAEVLAHAPPRFALAGLSMGGIVAMEVLARAPGRVARVALMDTNPLAEAPEMQARRVPQMERVARGGLAQVMRDEMKPNYLAPGPRRAEVLDLCMQMALALGPEVFRRQSLALMHRPDRQAALRGHDAPALVLCGRHDRLCPVERHVLMADLLPRARLEIVEGAGHLPTLEAPEETTAALMRWLEEED